MEGDTENVKHNIRHNTGKFDENPTQDITECQYHNKMNSLILNSYTYDLLASSKWKRQQSLSYLKR